MVEVEINGQAQQFRPGSTVLEVLQQAGIDPERVAIELNRSIVRRPLWETTVVTAGSQMEIVQFVGGG